MDWCNILIDDLWQLIFSFGHRSEQILWTAEILNKAIQTEKLDDLYVDAIKHHLEEILYTLHKKHQIKFSVTTMHIFARKGHLEYLKWAHANGCPWDTNTCSCAALNGHLEVLQWARENKCPWNEDTCMAAAMNGHLKVLKWSRANGCPWDAKTFLVAAEHGHIHVLKWARENGCLTFRI